MGVLANHVPSIEQLKPGLVEIIEESGGTKQFFRMYSWASISPMVELHRNPAPRLLDRLLTSNLFRFWIAVSGGFAVVQPNSELSINAVEGSPLEDFSAEVSMCLLGRLRRLRTNRCRFPKFRL
jgi:F-type H+-transporting ATPase subunit delta